MSLHLETRLEPAKEPETNLATEIARLIRSDAFRGSETLRNLLAYLATCAAEEPARPVKVREIAKTVFGRAEDFDSQTDSIVRVHAGRLRSKLAEYYLNEGAGDDLVISIPKGSYNLAWESRSQKTAPVEERGEALPDLVHATAADVSPHERQANRKQHAWTMAAAVLIALAAGWFSHAWLDGKTQKSRIAEPLRTFWRDFVEKSSSPVIVFSNLTMKDGVSRLVNTYATNGEVMGVYEISEMFHQFEKPVRAKPGLLLTWDDAKESDLVFVGGPLAETPLRDVALFKEFRFRHAIAGTHPVAGAILNLHPRGSEAAVYEQDLSQPPQFDYGLIALRPVLNPHRRALALAGIDFYGTQAAAEMVTQPEKIQELLTRLKVQPQMAMPAFEALISVKIHGGVPVQSEILAVRRAN